MNENQKKCFDRLRQFCHSEYHDASNLATLVRQMFPEANDTTTQFMLKVAAPYLDVRAELGKSTMEIIYILEKEGAE